LLQVALRLLGLDEEKSCLTMLSVARTIGLLKESLYFVYNDPDEPDILQLILNKVRLDNSKIHVDFQQ
jgi:hypothetical protein